MKILLSLLAFVCMFQISAQDINDCFVNMPDDMLPYLTKDNRKDLLDFYDNGRTAEIVSAFKTKVVLAEKTADFMFLKTTQSSDIQIKIIEKPDSITFHSVLMSGNDSVKVDSSRIMVLVFSEDKPFRTSIIEFYSMNWNKLDIPFVISPELFIKSSVDSEKEKSIKKLFMPDSFSMDINPNNKKITVHNHIKDYVPSEIISRYINSVKDSVIVSLF